MLKISFKVTGPMWNGPIHDKEFVRSMKDQVETAEKESLVPGGQKAYGTTDRMKGMLQVAESVSTEETFSFYLALIDH
jgi:tRNA G26 N,N-dimethylase Trm1